MKFLYYLISVPWGHFCNLKLSPLKIHSFLQKYAWFQDVHFYEVGTYNDSTIFLMFLLTWERGNEVERVRNINHERIIGRLLLPWPPLGIKPTTQVGALTRNQTMTSWFRVQCSATEPYRLGQFKYCYSSTDGETWVLD